MDTLSKFYAPTRAAWREWLKKNHKKSNGVWLIYDKGKHRVLSPDDITEEAICFGWIDSLPRSLDQRRAMIYVSPRKTSSNWSALNRERANRMIRQGLMQARGMKTIRAAKKSGAWLALKDVQQSIIPKDLKSALNKNKTALKNFDSFPPSSKRIILEWILNAKTPETRNKRITETVALAAKNIRANHYRQ